MKAHRLPLTPFAIALWSLWIVAGGLSFIWLEKGDMVLFINGLHGPTTDPLMHAWTYLGDGWMFLVSLLVVILLRRYHGVALLAAVALETALVHLGKRVLVVPNPRPMAWFPNPESLHLVEGVEVHRFLSFPSGHTATAFLLAMFVMLLHRRNWSTLVAFVLAMGVGISRIYLVQHFWLDVYVGSLVALVSALIIWLLFYRKEPTWGGRSFWR